VITVHRESFTVVFDIGFAVQLGHELPMGHLLDAPFVQRQIGLLGFVRNLLRRLLFLLGHDASSFGNSETTVFMRLTRPSLRLSNAFSSSCVRNQSSAKI